MSRVLYSVSDSDVIHGGGAHSESHSMAVQIWIFKICGNSHPSNRAIDTTSQPTCV